MEWEQIDKADSNTQTKYISLFFISTLAFAISFCQHNINLIMCHRKKKKRSSNKMRSHMSNSEQHQTPGRHKLKLVKAFQVSFLFVCQRGCKHNNHTQVTSYIYSIIFSTFHPLFYCVLFLTFYSLFVCWKGKSFTIDVKKFNGIGSRSSISSGGSRI